MNGMIIQNLRSQFVTTYLPSLFLLSPSFPYLSSFLRRWESIQRHKLLFPRLMSFPRRRESTLLALWFPAYAGMTENTGITENTAMTKHAGMMRIVRMIEGVPMTASMVKTQ